MSQSAVVPYLESVVENEISLSLVELCHACCTVEEHVIGWVVEGVLQPGGESPMNWRFSGQSLRRARLAVTFMQDLEINTPGIALVLDLLDKITVLETQLKRSRIY
jgi:chaperone modulatory protein CbpM